MNQLQGIGLLIVSAVAGSFVAKLAMMWFGKYIILLFRHRKISFEIDSNLSAVAERLGALTGDDFAVPESNQKYQVWLLPDHAFIFERATTRFNSFTPSIEGWLSESQDRTIVHANIQLSMSTVTNALAVVPAVWILYLLQSLLSDMWQHANPAWILTFLFVVVPFALVAFLRMVIHFDADDWQSDVNAFDSVVCGIG